MRKKSSNADLCYELLAAETEAEVIAVLKAYHLWDDPTAWRDYGDNENNFATIGNQQSKPPAALMEKFINSIDAVLMLECQRNGVDPESSQAPQSIAQAVEWFFGVENGNLANLTSNQRTELSNNIGFVATGRKSIPNYIVFDKGEGQSPTTMPDTLLSLNKSNKLRIPFVQGKFNMGSTGVLQFCGKHNFQLIISRRHPDIAAANDGTAPYWGFTLVRREAPSGNRRNSIFRYLAPNREIPYFASEKISIPLEADQKPVPDLEWGTIIKMYEYAIGPLRTNIAVDFYYFGASVLLPRPALPIRFYERRGYGSHTPELTFGGLMTRLEVDRSNNIEEGFPTTIDLRVNDEPLHVQVYVFRKEDKDKSAKYRKNEGIIFTINGQTHGIISTDFFRRKKVGMSYLADSLLLLVNCDRISRLSIEDLFMNSRDRLREGELRSAIERELEEQIRQHEGLRELRERRRREEIQNRLTDDKPLQDVLDNILKQSPTLSQLLMRGNRLSDPFKSQNAQSIPEEFIGQRFPTYFDVRKKHEFRFYPINRRIRIQFETDAENNYFGREDDQGEYQLRVKGSPYEQGIASFRLHNGLATLTLQLPEQFIHVGQDFDCELLVTDPSRIEPFVAPFKVQVSEPEENEESTRGKRTPPAKEGQGDRQLPDHLDMPNIKDIREPDWEDRGFDRESALAIINSGDEGYDFYVNLDNLYLRTEIKHQPKIDPRLLEAQFRYGLVLIGLAMLRGESTLAPEEGGLNIEEQTRIISSALAPFILPMINSLSSLQVEEGFTDGGDYEAGEDF